MTRNAIQPGTAQNRAGNRVGGLLLATVLLLAVTLTGCLVAGVRVEPRSLVWGSVALGSTGTPMAVTFSNIGSSPISISSIGISGANAGDFAIASKTCGATLASSSNCTVTVNFTPTEPGNREATLTFNHSGFGSSQTVSLSGTATGKISTLTVTPQTLSFGTMNVGSASAVQSVLLQSDGTTTISFASIAITGANPADFSIASNTCGSSLTGSSNCTIGIAFNPTAAGSRTATLVITDSASGSPHQVALSGTGNVPVTGSVTVSPTSIAFPDTSDGTSSAAQTVTLSNSSASTVSLGPVGLSGPNAGDFVIASNACGANLAAAANCTIGVQFKPTSSGSRTATLGVSANGTSLQVSLSGTGTNSSTSGVSVAPTSITFASVAIGSTSSPKSVTLSNGGTSALTISSIAITGANASDFAITSKTCGSTLIAASSCSVTMTFTPSASGTRTADLVFTDSAGNSPQTATLTGTASTSTTLSIAPTNPTVLVNATLQFSANASVTWTATCGTITKAGLYTAPSTAETCTVTATGTGTTPPSVSTSVNVTSGSTSGTLTVYPSSAAVFVGTDQAFQAQLSLVPDANPVTFSVDGVAGGNATTGTITAQGVYTAPSIAGTHVLTVQDSTLGTAATARITVFTDVNVDFGSRSTTLPPISPDIFGTERMDSLHNTADLDLVKAAGMQYARIYAQIPFVFPTNSTANWPAIDSIVQRVSANGVHVMLQMVQTPPWLQPASNPCGAGNPAAMPTDVNAWASLATQYVKHMDENFPGVVTDYEIWNEPNTVALCDAVASRQPDYMKLFAAAAPMMRAQAAADAQASGLPAARVGGPATAGVQSGWVSAMLSDPVISQNIDFLSYHDYLFSNHQTAAQWDTYNGVDSVYQRTQDSGAGPMHSYVFTERLIAAGQQPQGKNLPLYATEYNLNWSFLKNCCANDPTFSPVWNTMYAADMLNSVYNGAPNTPGHMVYFAATAVPYFCLVGEIDANMDCAYPTGSVPQPYPQYFAYQLLGAANYLDLQDGGYMAKTVAPPTLGNGLVVTAFNTKSQDAIVIVNPNQNTLSNVTVNLNNTGLSSAQGTLYQIVNGQSIQSSSVTLQNQSGTSYTTTVTIGPYSVQAISIHN
ncbi:choice-of-anchor D domain-containing protein [Telmatobacter sp. DSM 110680]|uniref:Choice-of-anchor D domain-containing protein n=1 Tax=Telmatobacter sp. DSM 110680 TaxID=3036704 RepID=A0AAU7DKY2_9BACT